MAYRGKWDSPTQSYDYTNGVVLVDADTLELIQRLGEAALTMRPARLAEALDCEWHARKAERAEVARANIEKLDAVIAQQKAAPSADVRKANLLAANRMALAAEEAKGKKANPAELQRLKSIISKLTLA